MTDARDTTATHEVRSPGAARIITAACIGNALEWYDIAVYSYFAVYVAKVFFPSGDSTSACGFTPRARGSRRPDQPARH